MHCDLIESWRRENFQFVFDFSVIGRKVAETYRNVWNHIVLGYVLV